MAFTSRAGSQSSKRTRRDRNAIVGLSGWLFADLLLGLAVVFLVAAEKPSPKENSDVCAQHAPDVVKQTVGAATEIITYFNFTPKAIAVSGGATPGVVYKQDPPSDKAICAGAEITLTYEPGEITTGKISLDGTCTLVLKNAASKEPSEIATIFENALEELLKPENNSSAETESCNKLSDRSHEIGFIIMYGYGETPSESARKALTRAFITKDLISKAEGVEKFASGAIRTFKILGGKNNNLKLEIFVLADGL